MSDSFTRLHAWAESTWVVTAHRLRRDERGEGVVSAAIAVLIMAGLGALMWVGFRAIWEDTEANTRDRISEIGR